MPRAMWKGAISFGLVTIPVAVYPATEEKTLRFNQLHDEDGGRVRYKRVCEEDGEEVSFEHIVKGYEVEKDRYVVLTDEDLNAIPVESSRAIDIHRFVDLDEIDPVMFKKSYYLVPEETGDSPRTYANFCAISHTPFDFTLSFCEVQPLSQKDIEAAEQEHTIKAPVRVRIVLPLQVVPNLIAALQASMKSKSQLALTKRVFDRQSGLKEEAVLPPALVLREGDREQRQLFFGGRQILRLVRGQQQPGLALCRIAGRAVHPGALAPGIDTPQHKTGLLVLGCVHAPVGQAD